jgi:hypothetical protein
LLVLFWLSGGFECLALSRAGIAGYVEDAVFQVWGQMYVEEEGRSRRGQPFVLLVGFLDIVDRELRSGLQQRVRKAN